MKKVILSMASGLVLVGCVSSGGPNDLAVMEGPSLAVPPNFELRPPSDKKREQPLPYSDDTTREMLLGDGQQPTQKSEASWLVEKATVTPVDDNIRQNLEQEHEAAKKEAEKGWLSGVFGKDDETSEE